MCWGEAVNIMGRGRYRQSCGTGETKWRFHRRHIDANIDPIFGCQLSKLVIRVYFQQTRVSVYFKVVKGDTRTKYLKYRSRNWSLLCSLSISAHCNTYQRPICSVLSCKSSLTGFIRHQALQRHSRAVPLVQKNFTWIWIHSQISDKFIFTSALSNLNKQILFEEWRERQSGTQKWPWLLIFTFKN